jgi:anaerobic carbon-monoxide dehydrogenase iron sulfur subunit
MGVLVMTEKALTYDPFCCSGCMFCMTACSTYNNGATSLSKSRIQILRHEGHAISKINEEDELVFDMISCQHCDQPFCMSVCPTLAIKKDTDGAVTIDQDRCVGCRTCLAVCPFGAISYDAARKRMLKCELCGGDPQCVKFCPTGALQFVPREYAHLRKRELLSRKRIQWVVKASGEKSL